MREKQMNKTILLIAIITTTIAIIGTPQTLQQPFPYAYAQDNDCDIDDPDFPFCDGDPFANDPFFADDPEDIREELDEIKEERQEAIAENDNEELAELEEEERELLDELSELEGDSVEQSIETEDESDNEGNENEGNNGDSDFSSQLAPQQQNNFQPIPPGQQNLPPAQQSGAGLNDACLKSGFSQERCNNLLFSDDPGGYCSTLKVAGLDCPKIQDPAFTYGNPEAARQQSEQQIENTERAIRGFEETVPNNLGQGFADD
jgi:hypothetical protein